MSQKNDYLKMHEAYLQHYGVKGMKWGVRKDEDAGPKGGGQTKSQQAQQQTSKAQATQQSKQKSSDLTGAAQTVTKGVKTITEAIPVKPGKKEYGTYPYKSDKELRDTVNRLNLERQYSDLVGDTKYVKSKSEKAKEFLQTAGAILAVGLTGLQIYAQIQQAKGKRP